MSRLPRKNAVLLGDALKDFLKLNHMTTGLNTQLVFDAWDDASGAAKYTTRRFYRGGKLYITLSSSVVRSQLYFQRDMLIEKINALLNENDLFTKDEPNVGFVQELILK